MRLRHKLGYACLGLFCAVAFVVGISYLFSSQITSYHEQVIAVRWQDLAPRVQTLLLVLMKGTGLAAIIAAISVSIITAIPLRRGQEWARWAVLAIGLTLLLPMFAGSLYLRITTGALSPWWLNAAAITILVVGVVLVGNPHQRARMEGTTTDR